MAKFRKKYLRPTRFNPKGHMYVGIVWPMEGSTGKQYDVELTDQGFECTCQGFAFHGYCKHSKAVLKKVEKTTFDNFVRVLWAKVSRDEAKHIQPQGHGKNLWKRMVIKK